MNVCVFGLWHLGCVTAACVAERFPTIGVDPNPSTVADLKSGKPPIFEPGMADLIAAGMAGGRLSFRTEIDSALAHADVVWVTFDTPVDDEDRANTTFVENLISSLFPYLRAGTTVLISSQMPVGSTSCIERAYRKQYPDRDVCFAYSPENLRLGKALDVFRNPGRIVIGTRTEQDRQRLIPLLSEFCDQLIWMSVESAEMTKHATNAFLATSIVFANEIARLCEEVGADAKQVERGLKTDERIGPRAYLGAGGPFAGGTLARDVAFLITRNKAAGVSAPLLDAIPISNNLQKDWPHRALEAKLGSVAGKSVAVLGLTYKPGTNTLRRSSAVELCHWLVKQQANVAAFDPTVTGGREELDAAVKICDSAVAALGGSDALVIATEWPEFRELRAADLVAHMRTPIVLDANRFLEQCLAGTPAVAYVSVGMPRH